MAILDSFIQSPTYPIVIRSVGHGALTSSSDEDDDASFGTMPIENGGDICPVSSIDVHNRIDFFKTIDGNV
ncbi:hypothetical protein BLOT_011720 [Blomia tropicalis]|nr:hypothetical protein BLOT_011720 [Blomia tropicalis]